MNRTLFVNGPILTMESPVPTDALFVEDGRIVALGTDALNATGATKVDLQGDALLPAFVDPHSHLSAAANSLLQVPLGEVCDFAQLEEAVAGFIRDNHIPAGQWVFGQGYDHNHLTEHAHPTRELLDKAAPNNPVVIQHASGHAGVFNTLALERLGALNEDCGLERDGQGELTGRGEENPFLDLLGRIPMDGLEDVLRAFQGAQEEYASHGITTAQEGLLQPVMAPVYQEILRRGLLYLDVNAYVPPADYDRLRGQFAQGVSASPGTFQVAGMKIFLDGSPQGGTAWVREPYAGGGCGTSTMTDGQVLSAFRQALDRDAQLLAHCNGDRAAEQYLTLLAQAEREAGKKLCRPVMIHAQLLGLDQLERVKALGVIPSFFVAHVYHWGEIHVKNFGLDRAGRISPAGSALAQGIPFTFHQDSPVIPPDMLETIWCACVRRTKTGRVLGAEERIPVEAALRAVTQTAALQYGLERELGTLRPGKRADFVLLSGDPLRTPPEELKKLQVERTIQRGRTIWSR